MRKMTVVRFISVGGILAAFAAIFQSAPVFLPVIGLALSPLSTLPIALAAFYNISLGFSVFFAAALILVFVSLQEAAILLFTTGLLGIVMGTLLFRKGILASILFSSGILTVGMMFLTYLLGVSVFGSLTDAIAIPLTFVIFLLFSLIYTCIWNICLRKFINYLVKLGFIDTI